MRITAATCLCLALLSTSACGSDTEPSAPPTPADSVATTSAAPPEDTASETTSAAPEDSDVEAMPELPDEAREQTEAGAEAFVEHYFAVYNALGQNPRPDVLEHLAAPDCSACTTFSDSIARLHESDQRTDGPFARVTSERTTIVDDSAALDVAIEQLGPDVLDATGASTGSGAEPTELQVLVQLEWQDEWVVSDITLQGR